MPQASNAQRALMAKWFPRLSDGAPNFEGINDSPPTRFLLARGWTEAGGMWTPPTPSYTPSIYEAECLLFLRDEWDHDFPCPLWPLLESQK